MCLVNGTVPLPRVSMVINHGPVEGALLHLKGREIYIDCPLSIFPTRLTSQFELTSFARSSSKDIRLSSGHGWRSLLHIYGQLCLHQHPPIDFSFTVDLQQRSPTHEKHNTISATQVATIRKQLIKHSAHDFSSALSAFAGLISAHFIFTMSLPSTNYMSWILAQLGDFVDSRTRSFGGPLTCIFHTDGNSKLSLHCYILHGSSSRTSTIPVLFREQPNWNLRKNLETNCYILMMLHHGSWRW